MLITSRNRLMSYITLFKTDLARVHYSFIRLYLNDILAITSPVIFFSIFFLFFMNFLMLFSYFITNYAPKFIITWYKRVFVAMLTFEQKC